MTCVAVLIAATRRTTARLAAALMVLTAVVAVTSSSAAAEIEIDAPASSTVGLPVSVIVTVTDSGQPTPDVEVILSREAEIGGVLGFPELAKGVTDANGVAVLEFVQRAETGGPDLYRVSYAGVDGPVEMDFEMVVHPGEQQYVTTAGVDSGLASVWWLYFVLAVIWVSLTIAVYQLVAVARASEGARTFAAAPYIMVGFVVFTGVGMFLVVGTRPQTHLVLTPTEPFDRDPAALVGVDYEYTGHSGHADSRSEAIGHDLDGETIYIQAGCAGCHGLANSGQGVVGGHLPTLTLDDANFFRDFVRLGPGGMPSYGEGVLSATEIDRIREWALAERDGLPDGTVGGLTPVAGGPYVGQPREGVIFDGRGSANTSGDIVAYRWDFGDGGPVVDFGTASAVVEHSFLSDGIYEVTLTVVDEAGTSASTTTTALIGDAHPPITSESDDEAAATTEPEGATGEASEAPAADQSEAGEEIFVSMCAACHGPGGVGGNLAESTTTPEEWRSAIVNGQGAMPSFEGQLTDEEIDLVIDYLVVIRGG